MEGKFDDVIYDLKNFNSPKLNNTIKITNNFNNLNDFLEYLWTLQAIFDDENDNLDDIFQIFMENYCDLNTINKIKFINRFKNQNEFDLVIKITKYILENENIFEKKLLSYIFSIFYVDLFPIGSHLFTEQELLILFNGIIPNYLIKNGSMDRYGINANNFLENILNYFLKNKNFIKYYN